MMGKGVSYCSMGEVLPEMFGCHSRADLPEGEREAISYSKTSAEDENLCKQIASVFAGAGGGECERLERPSVPVQG